MADSLSATTIDANEVKHIAGLISLQVSDEEVKALSSQLTQAAEYVNVLNELDLSGTEPTSQVTGLINVFREDEITPSLTQEEVLQNAANTYNGYFVVPAVIEKE